MSTTADKQILTAHQMQQKIKRMAVEIYEHNFEAQELTVVGISQSGYALASMLVHEMQDLPIMVKLVRLTLDKTARQQPEVTLDQNLHDLEGKPLVLVDDVLNTGRTLWYALNVFSSIHLPKVDVAVMVARNHSQFPIKANFVGYSISTTLSDHIKVEMEHKEGLEIGAYLTV
jgi:pyrimidine operon attenuation protein/uracil phosphoribosyltransferase